MTAELAPTAPVIQDVILGNELTASERSILSALLNQDAQIEVVIPAELDNPEVLWEQLRVCVKAKSRLDASVSKVKPLIGRILVVIQNYPELFTSRGYKTFDDFMTNGVERELGISRAEAYHVKRMAQSCADVSLDRAGRIGVHKLSKIAGLYKEATSPDQREELLSFAETHSLDEVKIMVAKTGGFEPGDLDMDDLLLHLPRSLKQRWQEFVRDTEIIGYVGSDQPCAVFEAMIDETELEWRRKAAEARMSTAAAMSRIDAPVRRN